MDLTDIRKGLEDLLVGIRRGRALRVIQKAFDNGEINEDLLEKSRAKALQAKHLGSSWKTINGAKVLVGGNGEVIVGAGGNLSKKDDSKKLSKDNLNRLNKLFTNFNVKSIFEELDFIVKKDGDSMPVALSILEMIEENSNDFTKDIADKGIMAENNHTLTYKQKWSLAYQIKNNLDIYKIAIKKYSAF